MRNILVLLLSLFASTFSYASLVCEKDDFGIEVCRPQISNSETCEAMSVWESDLLHPDNESYIFEIRCQGYCKEKDTKIAMKAALLKCEYGISNFQDEDVACVKVECGLRILD